MKKMLPAAIVLTLTACTKKQDRTENPRPATPVWNLTEIAGSGTSAFFHYATAGEPFAYVTRSTEGTDSIAVAWAGGKPVFTYLFFNQQQRIDRSFVYSGDLLTRIQYHNFDHSGQWTVTDYDSLVYQGNRLTELHVVNGGARNQLFKLYWDGANVTRSESYDLQGDVSILTETTTYAYNDRPGLANAFGPWFYFIFSGRQISALSQHEMVKEERRSANGALRWRNTYGPLYLEGGRLERMTRLREDFTIPATENSANNYVYLSSNP